MKVLFVSSSKGGDIGSVVCNQGGSLEKAGVKIDYFLINPGIKNYIACIPEIRRKFKKGGFDLIHAHYGFSGFAASLAGRFPIVVSLMGSDVYLSGISRFFIRIFSKYRWNATIAKSQRIRDMINNTGIHVIPNGVDLSIFKPIPCKIAREKINYLSEKKTIIFLASKNRTEKNFELAAKSVSLLRDINVSFTQISGIQKEMVPFYLNSADVLLLTSKWEGSPNIIKEAMACNCPIVATDVGDIKWIIGDTEGCYVTSFDPKEIAIKLGKALNCKTRITGRKRIIELGLDSQTISHKVINVYEEVLRNTADKNK